MLPMLPAINWFRSHRVTQTNKRTKGRRPPAPQGSACSAKKKTWKLQEISNERTHGPRTPTKTWVSNSSSKQLRGPLGFGPIPFLMGKTYSNILNDLLSRSGGFVVESPWVEGFKHLNIDSTNMFYQMPTHTTEMYQNGNEQTGPFEDLFPILIRKWWDFFHCGSHLWVT